MMGNCLPSHVAAALVCGLLLVSSAATLAADPLDRADVYEDNYGNGAADLIPFLRGLAQLHFDRSRYEDARVLYERARRIAEATGGADHPNTARCLQDLAAIDAAAERPAAASLVSYFCGGIALAEKRSNGVDYALALQSAKRWVRQQDKWQSPYYWATFVLVGPQ